MFSRTFRAPQTYESGLFHFITEKQVNGQLLGRSVVRKEVLGGREAWFVSLPLANGESDAHLSFDRFYVATNGKSPLDYFYTHAHATFQCEYLEKNELIHIMAHAYYNRHGMLINCNAMKILPDGTLQPITMSKNLKAFIYEKARVSASGFLEQLLDEKQKNYQVLQEKFSDTALSLALDQWGFQRSSYQALDKKEQAIQKINELLQLIEKLNCYDERRSDKRDLCLRKNLEYLQAGNFPVMTEEDLTINESDQSVAPLEKNKQKKKQKKKIITKSASSSMLEDFDFDDLIAANAAEVSPSAESVNYKNVDSILQFLRALSEPDYFSLEIRNVIRLGHKILSLYFKSKIEEGDIEEVAFLYPFFSSIQWKEMPGFFSHFLAHLEKCLDPELAEKLVKVGDFFYEQSEIYRAKVFEINSQRYLLVHAGSSGSNDVELSLLFRLFERNQLAAFRMFLRQGVRSISQTTQCSFRGMPMSLPATIIFDFMANPNLKFIQALREYRGLQEEEPDVREVYFSDLREDEITVHYRRLSEARHSFSLAIRRCKHAASYSLALIQDLAENTDLKTIIYEIPNLLNSPNFRFVVFPIAHESKIKILKNREQAVKVMQNLQHPVNGKSSDKVGIVFFPDNGKEHPIINYLLQKISIDFPQLELTEQQEIIQLLTTKAEKAAASPNKTEQILAITAQLCNSFLQNLTPNDYANRIHLFCLRGLILKKMNNIPGSENFYMQAEEMLNDLSKEILASADADFFSVREEIFLGQMSILAVPGVKKISVLYELAKSCEKLSKLEDSKKYYGQAKTHLDALSFEVTSLWSSVLDEVLERVDSRIAAQALSQMRGLSDGNSSKIIKASPPECSR